MGTLGSGRVLCWLLLELLAAVAVAAAVGSGLGGLRFRQGAELIFEASDCDLAELGLLSRLSEIASQNSATAAGLTSPAGTSASVESAAASVGPAAALLLPRGLRRALSGREAVAVCVSEGAAASVGPAAAPLLRLPRVLRQALSGREAVAAKQPVPGAGATRTWHCRLPSGSTCSDLPCERGVQADMDF